MVRSVRKIDQTIDLPPVGPFPQCQKPQPLQGSCFLRVIAASSNIGRHERGDYCTMICAGSIDGFTTPEIDRFSCCTLQKLKHQTLMSYILKQSYSKGIYRPDWKALADDKQNTPK